jgi:outer membrane protein OmpA-like peptidoglycan-associated protein
VGASSYREDMTLRLPGILVALVAALLFAPSAAHASHIQGGSIDAGINANGHLVGVVTFLSTGSCLLGDDAYEMPNITVTNPSNQTYSFTPDGKYQRCLPTSMTAVGTFDIDLAAQFGSAPDGAYTLRATASARVGGIVNGGSSSAEFNARVTKTGTTPSYSPKINSAVANAVAKNYPFKQSLNGVDPDGSAVTYASRAGQNGPASDLVTIGTDGVVSMTAAQTDALNHGAYFSYTVRVLDAGGDFSERDVLLKVTGTNVPPAVNGLSGAPIVAVRGAGPQNVAFTATDANAGQTVSLEAAAGAPAWVSLSAPAGNPVNATLVVNPPANVPAGTYAFNIDAVDSDSSAPLFASEPVTVTVIDSLPAKPVVDSAPSALARASVFGFTLSAGQTAECQVDGGAWAACASPFTPAGLADGPHALKLRAVDGNGVRSEAAELSWTLDTAAPAAPALIGATEGAVTTKTARFVWTGEDGGSFECSVDGGAFVPCASPFALGNVANGKHTFVVRQIDAAGNVGVNQSVTWTVGDAPKPTAPGKVQAITGTNAAVAVQGDTASVGCRVSGGTLASCVVDVFAYDKAAEAGVSVRANASAARSKAKLVLIGRGRVKARAGDNAKRLAVDIELNATGRRLVAEQITGIAVVLKIEARTVQGPKLNSRATAKLVPQTQLIVPEKGLFATGSTKVAKTGAKLIKSLGDRFGKVKTVTCVGHTDSVGSSVTNYHLGLARAKAVCAALKKQGARGAFVVESDGEARPRATNATAQGRALNRRVEIRVRYR